MFLIIDSMPLILLITFTPFQIISFVTLIHYSVVLSTLIIMIYSLKIILRSTIMIKFLISLPLIYSTFVLYHLFIEHVYLRFIYHDFIYLL
jgi:hypothetical protein